MWAERPLPPFKISWNAILTWSDFCFLCSVYRNIADYLNFSILHIIHKYFKWNNRPHRFHFLVYEHCEARKSLLEATKLLSLLNEIRHLIIIFHCLWIRERMSCWFNWLNSDQSCRFKSMAHLYRLTKFFIHPVSVPRVNPPWKIPQRKSFP